MHWLQGILQIVSDEGTIHGESFKAHRLSNKLSNLEPRPQPEASSKSSAFPEALIELLEYFQSDRAVRVANPIA